MEKRFCFEPFKKVFFDCKESHVTEINNRKLQKKFDTFIRGIIKDNTLYLRVFYPFENINELTYKELIQHSNTLLKENLKGIKSVIKKEYKLTQKIIKLSVTNTDLKGIIVNL